MTTIDQLNFEVILNDQEFNAKVKNDIALANELNTSLSKLLEIKSKVGKFTQDDVNNNRKANKILEDNAKTQEKITREKEKTRAVQEKLNASIQRATKGYQTQSRILNELKGMALGYLSVQGASQLLSSLVRVTGEFETQRVSLGAMIGDLNKAENIIEKIKGLAVESPFQFKELTTYAKQLSAFSVPANELFETTKMLADVSAGLGVDMNRIILAYGQVRSAAFLRGQEVRQFTEAGIPILDELAKQFSELEGRVVSTGEVFDKISDRLVPFEMVANIFKDMTSEGGKFFNMQEVRAETLTGKWSNLKDAFEVMLNEIGSAQSDKIKGAFDWARKLMENYEETGKVLVELVAAYGVYKAAIIAADVATSTFSTTNYKLIHALVSAGKWVATNPYALLAAGITAVGFAAYKSISQLEPFEKIRKSVTESEAKYNNTLALEEANLEKLYTKLRLATKGTEEYESARREIYTKYASYISALKAEGVQVNDLVGIYDKLKTKINEAVQAKMRNIAVNDLEREFGDQMDKIEKSVDRTLKSVKRSLKRELTIGEEVGLRKYILGGDEDILKSPELMGINNFLKNVKGFNVVEYTRKQVASVVNEYQKGKDKIDAIFGEEQPVEGGVTPFVYPKIDTEGKSPSELVQEQIDAVRRLKSAYDTLAPYMNGDMLRKTLTALFPNADQELIKSLDFRGKLVELAAELNQFDQVASQKLLDSISGEKAGEIVSAFKAIETYKNMLDDWLGEDFTLTGKGITFDVSKIIRDLNNQYAKINQKAIKASDLLRKAQEGDEAALATVREAYGEEVWQKYLINGKETIEELARLERESAQKTAQEKINDLVKAYVKDKTSGLNLTDWGDKSLQQIIKIQEEIERLSGEEIVFDDELLDRIKETGLTLEDFIKGVEKEYANMSEDTEEEILKKIEERAKDTARALSTLGGELKGLGEAMESSGLAELGGSLEKAAGLAGNMIEALKAKDTIAIISNMVSVAISSITDIISNTAEAERKLYESTLELKELMTEDRRNAYDGMFGTDEMGLAIENLKILTESYEDYQKKLSKFSDEKKLRRNKLSGESIVFEKKSVSDILGEIADTQGWEMFRENGELNIDAIRERFDAYSKYLTKKQRKVVEELIESNNFYTDAATQQAEYLRNLFGGVADDIATSMVDAFIESGDAAINMGDIISDVSKQMVADLIKSIYLMPILNDYAEELDKISKDASLTPTQKVEMQLEALEGALQEISATSQDITDTAERFEKYFSGGKQGTSSLGEGIKGITEDQANLLASYLNAIRADVSYSKALWVRMDANLQRIADMFASSPTLMEYQAQIAANTFDTAQATQAILGELRSVMTSDGGDTAIRIYS